MEAPRSLEHRHSLTVEGVSEDVDKEAAAAIDVIRRVLKAAEDDS